jgi:hypothetical protein
MMVRSTVEVGGVSDDEDNGYIYEEDFDDTGHYHL